MGFFFRFSLSHGNLNSLQIFFPAFLFCTRLLSAQYLKLSHLKIRKIIIRGLLATFLLLTGAYLTFSSTRWLIITSDRMVGMFFRIVSKS